MTDGPDVFVVGFAKPVLLTGQTAGTLPFCSVYKKRGMARGDWKAGVWC